MVKPRFNPIVRVSNPRRQSIIVPDQYTVNLQKPNRPLNHPTRRIIDNFYHLNYDATQTLPKLPDTCDQATNTDPPPPALSDHATNIKQRRSSTKSESSLYIRVKRSFLKKIIERMQWQTEKLDLVRDYLHQKREDSIPDSGDDDEGAFP